MKTVITYVYSVKMKYCNTYVHFGVFACGNVIDMSSSLCAQNAIQRIFVSSHPVWRAVLLHLYHLDCCNAYDENKTFELVFSSLEVEASLCGLLGSMVGREGGVAASVLQVIQ